MPTKRVPIGRPPAPRITVKAIKLFEAMRRCADREQWWCLHSDLVDELRTAPWEWPVIQNPDTSGEPNREAQERWRALANAARELRRAQRKATRPRRAPVSSSPPEPPPSAVSGA
jgi:hypothetical protein